MLMRMLEQFARPFWAIRAKFTRVKVVKGNLRADVNRVKGYKRRAGQNLNKAKNVSQQAGNQSRQASGMIGGAKQGNAGGGAASGAGQGGAMQGDKRAGIRKKGIFKKKHFCNVCNQQLDKSWDSCPYCNQASAPAAAKTQAFVVDPAAGGRSVQLLGWVVPLEGPHRGELYSLAPVSSIGTDAGCTVVLADQYMSTLHAEIRVEGGVWVVEDKGSTNGTFVNDKRIDKRELVDNDFIKFGNSLVKFKSL